MKKLAFAFFLILFPILVVPVGAEFYRYIDENGQKRWTDDLSQVPKDQRASAQRLESAEETPTDGQADQEQSDNPASAQKSEERDQNKPNESVEVSREELEKEKAELDAFYQRLVEERKQLEQLQSEALSDEERVALKARILAFNAQTEQYDSQLNAFNEKIRVYNQSITSTPSPKSE